MMTTSAFDFDSSTPGIGLAGRLVSPADGDPIGLALLLSGSGPQDRDESIAGTRPFLALANGLAARGIAAASWDDRGVGDSGGDYLAIDAPTLVADVGVAIGALRERLPGLPIALVGHSQGALIGAAAAARWPRRVDALALLAGIGRPGREALLAQHRAICRADGLAEEVVEASVVGKQQIFEVLLGAQSRIDAGDDAVGSLATARARLADLLGDPAGDTDSELELVLDDLMEWEWRYLLAIDPADDLRRVECPVLVITGARDRHVDPDADVQAIRRAVLAGGNRELRAHVVDGVNHLFQRCATGSPSEYATAGEPWAAGTLELIADWLRETLGGLRSETRHGGSPTVTPG